ncbi:hypothetical protein JTB14_034205 [Gonioctena quinquepunctata]|nr:hypothetical protein JTB14_034205 [Gonioctena quinquepunctata]
MKYIFIVLLCLLSYCAFYSAAPISDQEDKEDNLRNLSENYKFQNVVWKEDMETANALLFRPYFEVRRNSERKYRVNRQKKGRRGYSYSY